MVIGHESAGDDRRGRRRASIRTGSVSWWRSNPVCRADSCPQCLRGRYNLCPDVDLLRDSAGRRSISGFVAIDAAFAHPAPAGLSAEQAAMAEPVSVGIWAARKCGVAGGDRVLVTAA